MTDEADRGQGDGARRRRAARKRGRARPAARPPRGARSARRRRRPGALLKTGDLVERTGLSRQVIYTYVTMGLIQETERTAGGHKLFDESVLTHIKLIQNLNEHGYTLRDIKTIFFRRKGGAGGG